MIPNDKIAIVTGDPRSGTSLLMQTLVALEVPVSGHKYPIDAAPEQLPGRMQNKIAQSKVLNPLGFYELPGVVMRGMASIGTHGGKAIKIMAPGVIRTPTSIVGNSILCLRDPRWVAQSQTRLTSNVEVLGARGWENPAFRVSPIRYALDMGAFAYWFSQQDQSYRDLFLVVDYDEHVNAPQATVNAVANHLGYNIRPVSIVDPKLRRSPADFVGWPAEFADDGALCEDIYAALKSKDVVAMQAVAVRFTAVHDRVRRESTMVYDPRLCCNVAMGGLRHIESNPSLLSRLMESREFRIRNGYTYDTSPVYGGEVTSTYTRSLPLDMGGDQLAHMVLYLDMEMTQEEAQARHEQRRRDGILEVDVGKVAAALGRV